MAASFGRGFFVLDDISALRHLTPQTLAQEGTLFPVGRPARRLQRDWILQRARANRTDPNPPFGALLTYYLRDNAQGDAKIVLTVTDSAGKQVRQIDASGQAGLHRTPWDLRETAPAGQGGGGRGRARRRTMRRLTPEGDAAAAQPAGRGGAAGGRGGGGRTRRAWRAAGETGNLYGTTWEVDERDRYAAW